HTDVLVSTGLTLPLRQRINVWPPCRPDAPATARYNTRLNLIQRYWIRATASTMPLPLGMVIRKSILYLVFLKKWAAILRKICPVSALFTPAMMIPSLNWKNGGALPTVTPATFLSPSMLTRALQGNPMERRFIF